MSYSYIKSKAVDTAGVISKKHGIDFRTAFFITEAVWEEAKKSVLKVAGTPEWQRLPFSRKSEICAAVIRGLLDKKRLVGVLAGEKKSIV
ncbi:MAG: hypothetical protein HY889_08220 [Deltaproteobacteria bacterium]|nr:hypothetical protein [Deltaproteobacteria bacterium]